MEMRVYNPYKTVLETTGAGYTNTASHEFYLQIDPKRSEMFVAPVAARIVKGYMNGRYYYQIIDKRLPVVSVLYEGSINSGFIEKVNITLPEEIDVMVFSKIAKIIEKNKNLIDELLAWMSENSPGRLCLYPLKADFLSATIFEVENDPVEIRYALERLSEIFSDFWYWHSYTSPATSWFTGARARMYIKDHNTVSTVVGEVRQGNLVFSSKIMILSGKLIEPERISEFSIDGNEGNTHRIQFQNPVYLVVDDNQHPVFFAEEPTIISVTHPQHKPIKLAAYGVFRATHLYSPSE